MAGRVTHVFFYGSLLSLDELKKVGIESSRCKPALCPGYHIAFNKDSRTRCAAANLVHCRRCIAAGIVCDAADNIENVLGELDKREKGYEPEVVRCVTIPDGEVIDAYAYISGETLNEDEVISCILECSDKRLDDYLGTIAKGICSWSGMLPVFKEFVPYEYRV